MRFKCVCKQGLSLITRSRKLLLVVPSNSGSNCSCTVKFINFEVEASSCKPKPPNGHRIHVEECPCRHMLGVIGCCDGLLCILAKQDLILWNPSSRKCKLVPRPKKNFGQDHFRNQFGLGYDHSTKDYKIVRLYPRRPQYDTAFQIYSLKTNSWSREAKIPFLIHFEPMAIKFGISVNGALFWPIRLIELPYVLACILRFDLTDEEFSFICLPTDLIDKKDRLSYLPAGCFGRGPFPSFDLIDFGGRLSVFCCVDSIDMWVMEDSCLERMGVEKWIMVVRIPVLPRNYVEEVLQRSYNQYCGMKPIFCFGNGTGILMNIMISSPDGDGGIRNEWCFYNKDENTFKKIEIQGAKEFDQLVSYTESLIYSPL